MAEPEAAPAAADTIGFFGEDFAVPERINEYRVTMLMAMGRKGDTSDLAAGADAMTKLVRQVVADGDYERFMDVCDAERVSDEEIMGYVGAVMKVLSGRPTAPPRDFSAGRSITAEKSTSEPEASATTSEPTPAPQPAVERPETVPPDEVTPKLSRDTEVALTHFSGRPDLQLVTLEAASRAG